MADVSRLSRWLGLAPRPAEGAPPGDDWRLWHGARHGDAASAHALVRQLMPQALSLAQHLLGRAEDADDAVQDAFVRLWRSAPTDTHGARLSTYFNAIVINRCRSHLVARREAATDPDDLAMISDARQVQHGHDDAVHAADPASGRSGAASHPALAAALARLPKRQRMAIVMWAYADATATDIAQALDIDPNAAHQLLHRARSALRSHLSPGPP